LHDAAKAQAGPAATPGPVEQSWQAGSRWFRSQLIQIFDTCLAVCQRIVEWLSVPEPSQPPAGAEPGTAAVRSSQ
jgi:hypothetical protein